MKRKSIQQTQVTVRKSQQRVSKKSKVAVIRDTLLQLPLYNFKWPKSRTSSDCVICAFQTLGVINSQQAKNIRAQFTPQHLNRGLKHDEVYDILNYKYGTHNWELTTVSGLVLNKVLEMLNPNHGFFLRLEKESDSRIGHMVLVVRDEQDGIGLVDPTQQIIEYNEDIKEYIYRNNYSTLHYQIITMVV